MEGHLQINSLQISAIPTSVIFNVPISSGNLSNEFSEAWKSVNACRADMLFGSTSNLFLVTSSIDRLHSFVKVYLIFKQGIEIIWTQKIQSLLYCFKHAKN